jgi:hypothetical protein
MVGGFATGTGCALAMGWKKKGRPTHKPKIETIFRIFIVSPHILSGVSAAACQGATASAPLKPLDWKQPGNTLLSIAN